MAITIITFMYTVRNATPDEFKSIGKLLVRAYSRLDGFPKEADLPDYYNMLANVGNLTGKPETELLVAVSPEGKLAGAVVYFGDMQYYGSGGMATKEKNASGFRLLAVSPDARGRGIGKLLTHACIQKAIEKKNSQVIIHTTKAMQTAWTMYESIGFTRSIDLDFMQGELAVYGFRLSLQQYESMIKGEALMRAIERHDVSSVQVCLNDGADPNYLCKAWADRPDGVHQPTTPLRLVIFCISDNLLNDDDLRQHAEIAKLLLKHGGDPKPAMQLAELRYGKYNPALASSPFLDVRHIVAKAN